MEYFIDDKINIIRNFNKCIKRWNGGYSLVYNYELLYFLNVEHLQESRYHEDEPNGFKFYFFEYKFESLDEIENVLDNKSKLSWMILIVEFFLKNFY